MKDIVIIGGGPAGLSAAIYAKRAMKDILIIEKEAFTGGQIINTEAVDNYLGLPGLSGFNLAMQYNEHVKKLGVEIKNGSVKSIENNGDIKKIILENDEIIETKSIIIATGAKHKRLNIKGEKELTGAGVSYCALCDGAFFRGLEVIVVGGGDVALGDALYLAGVCKKVYLVHRRDELRGARTLQERIFNTENIEFVKNSVLTEIGGDGMVEYAMIKNVKTYASEKLEVSGVFIAVGMEPVTAFAKNVVEMDSNGYIIASENCKTSAKGICVAGDCRTKNVRQLVTAVADGAVSVYSLDE